MSSYQPPRPPSLGPSPLTALLAPLLRPLFNHEGPDVYGAAMKHNSPFAVSSNTGYQTILPPHIEQAFRHWLVSANIPFDPNAKTVDYDMRGYYAANPNASHQNGQHFPDTFKTPYDSTFSGESKYAKPHTPFVWHGNTLVDTRTGRIVFKSK